VLTFTNLVAWYDASSYTAGATTWNDRSSNNNHAIVSGSISVQTDPAGFKFMRGSPSSKITLPANLPTTYTVFHVARYAPVANAVKKRILSSVLTTTAVNWVSGFHAGVSGVAYKLPGPGWVPSATNQVTSGWMLSSDQSTLYRAQGVQQGSTTPYTGSSFAIGVNVFDPSDFDVAAIIIYARAFSTSEMMEMEDFLADLYKLPLNRSSGET
jgi:hypothetical protein